MRRTARQPTPARRYVRLGTPVTIIIAVDSSVPDGLTTAIQKAFAFTEQDDLLGRPIPDVEKALATLGLKVPPGQVPELGAPSEIHGNSVLYVAPQVEDHGVQPPRVIYSAAPTPDRGHYGVCVVGLVVEADGIPDKIHVAYSMDPDLNQNAIEAVKQYRFLPSLKDGHPVPVQINIEVNFR